MIVHEAWVRAMGRPRAHLQTQATWPDPDQAYFDERAKHLVTAKHQQKGATLIAQSEAGRAFAGGTVPGHAGPVPEGHMIRQSTPSTGRSEPSVRGGCLFGSFITDPAKQVGPMPLCPAVIVTF